MGDNLGDREIDILNGMFYLELLWFLLLFIFNIRCYYGVWIIYWVFLFIFGFRFFYNFINNMWFWVIGDYRLMINWNNIVIDNIINNW